MSRIGRLAGIQRKSRAFAREMRRLRAKAHRRSSSCSSVSVAAGPDAITAAAIDPDDKRRMTR